MTCVAVTGATGLVGSAIAARLGAWADVVRIGRRAGCDQRADFAEPETVAALDLAGVDTVIHCAGIVDEDFSGDVERAFRHALQGTERLVAAAIRGKVRRFALLSSAHVYGPMSGCKDEQSPIDPRSDYAIAHFATEQVLRRAAAAFETTAVFRPCAVFGPLPDPAAFRRWSLIPFAFPRACVQHRAIALRSNGEQRRNFVGSSDIAASIEAWLCDAGSAGFHRFNPVGETTLSVWQFAELCAERARETLGIEVSVSRVAEDAADGLPFDYRTEHQFCRGAASLTDHVDAMLALAERMDTRA